MIHRHPDRTRQWIGRGLASLLAGLACQAGALLAQSPVPIPELPPLSSPAETSKSTAAKRAVAQQSGDAKAKDAKATDKADRTIHDPNVKKAQCCGGLLGMGGGGGSCANGKCVPGRKHCSWCDYDTVWGRAIGAVYDCVCCPDNCYEPRWIDTANAAFWQDGARPVTQTRIRWTAGYNNSLPDTAEFFWAKLGGRGPGAPETNVDHHELSLYQEFGAKRFSFFVDTPYRQVGPDINPTHSGFGDVNLGTKTLFLDCELIQMGFMFRTYIPSGTPATAWAPATFRWSPRS